MCISKLFKKATKPEPQPEGLSQAGTEQSEKTQKDYLSEALAKSLLRQTTPLGTIYW
jgi:hypothetical protein